MRTHRKRRLQGHYKRSTSGYYEATKGRSQKEWFISFLKSLSEIVALRKVRNLQTMQFFSDCGEYVE